MSLKHLNSGSAARPLPKDWTPDTRFIDYKYPPIAIPEHPLPQEPAATATPNRLLEKLGTRDRKPP